MMNKSLMAFVLIALACGCGKPIRAKFIEGASPIGGASYSEGMSAASFDMGCPKEKLEVVELSANSVGVFGCGKSMRYEAVDSTAGRHWVPVSGKRDEASK